jgi:Ras-related GTP-binding protein A/B
VKSGRRICEATSELLDGTKLDARADTTISRECLSALQANSPDAHVFCLLHKMDLVEAPRRRSVYASRVEELRKKSVGSTIHCFATSIMDETIYKVSRTARLLIPVGT